MSKDSTESVDGFSVSRSKILFLRFNTDLLTEELEKNNSINFS